MRNQVGYSLFGLLHRQVPVVVCSNIFIRVLFFFSATEEMRNKPNNLKNTTNNTLKLRQ